MVEQVKKTGFYTLFKSRGVGNESPTQYSNGVHGRRLHADQHNSEFVARPALLGVSSLTSYTFNRGMQIISFISDGIRLAAPPKCIWGCQSRVKDLKTECVFAPPHCCKTPKRFLYLSSRSRSIHLHVLREIPSIYLSCLSIHFCI